MSHLADTISYHLNELRDELRTAQLTDTARMTATASVQVETIRLLIQPTADQERALERITASFEGIADTVRRFGPTPTNSRIRQAFVAAREALGAAEAALIDTKPSDKSTGLGL